MCWATRTLWYLEARKPPNATEPAGSPEPGLCPLPVQNLFQSDLEKGLGVGGGGGGAAVRPGGGHEKVWPGPTWTVFAVSGLAAWLIDNRPLRKFICFLLIFIPVGDISTVLMLPGATGAKQECGAGSGNPTSPILKDSGRPAGAGRKAGTG